MLSIYKDPKMPILTYEEFKQVYHDWSDLININEDTINMYIPHRWKQYSNNLTHVQFGDLSIFHNDLNTQK